VAPSLSEATGAEARAILDAAADGRDPVDILCLEGSVIHGPNGTGGFHLMAGTGRPMRDMIHAIAQHATHVIAVGSCAAYGGITMGGGNAVEAGGLAYNGRTSGGLLGADSAGGAGCRSSISLVARSIRVVRRHDPATGGGTLTAADLDEWERPLAYTSSLVHHGCARNEYYEFKASAEELGDLGCMMENLGCKGTQARADCNTRAWNGSGSCLTGDTPASIAPRRGLRNRATVFQPHPRSAAFPSACPPTCPRHGLSLWPACPRPQRPAG
jgi:Ni,Fe-hydrogenase I small subunit